MTEERERSSRSSSYLRKNVKIKSLHTFVSPYSRNIEEMKTFLWCIPGFVLFSSSLYLGGREGGGERRPQPGAMETPAPQEAVSLATKVNRRFTRIGQPPVDWPCTGERRCAVTALKPDALPQRLAVLRRLLGPPNLLRSRGGTEEWVDSKDHWTTMIPYDRLVSLVQRLHPDLELKATFPAGGVYHQFRIGGLNDIFQVRIWLRKLPYSRETYVTQWERTKGNGFGLCQARNVLSLKAGRRAALLQTLRQAKQQEESIAVGGELSDQLQSAPAPVR